MGYTAVINIDEDRWEKRPFGIVIKDEEGGVVYEKNYIESREECYRIARKYGISSKDVEDYFY